MKLMQATDLRRDLFNTLKRLAYEKEPIFVERRGKTIAAIVTPESVIQESSGLVREQPRTARPPRLMVDPKAIADFCAKHRIKTLYLFGSVLTDRFDADSDVDVMFESDGPSPDYFAQMNMSDELASMFSRPVDLVSRNAIEAAPNRFRKASILNSARVIFAR